MLHGCCTCSTVIVSRACNNTLLLLMYNCEAVLILHVLPF